MFWQLHYEADDLTLLGDYTVCVLQHQTLRREDINKMQQASSWTSYTETSLLCSLENSRVPISDPVIAEWLSPASSIKSRADIGKEFIRSNSYVVSGLWHFLTQRCNWEITSRRGVHQGHAGCRQFHFIYDNPSLQSCSSSITPKASIAYSGFEASPGRADRLCEISHHKPYKILSSDEMLSPFESLFLHAFGMWPLRTSYPWFTGWGGQSLLPAARFPGGSPAQRQRRTSFWSV